MKVHHLFRIQRGKIFLRDIVDSLPILVKKVHSDQGVRVPGIIQVIVRIASHGENFPGIHLHNNAAHILRTVSGMKVVLELLVKFQKIFFHNTLNVGVNGCDQGIAIFCRNRPSLQLAVIIQIPVLPSRGSG